MAISAVVTLTKNGLFPEQTTQATCVITNTSTSPVNVNAFNPFATIFGQTQRALAIAVGIPQVGGAYPSVIPGSGTLTIVFGVTPHAPNTSQPVAEPSQLTYSIGAEILTSDGADTFAVSAPLTVIPGLPVPLQFGQLIFSNTLNSALVAAL